MGFNSQHLPWAAGSGVLNKYCSFSAFTPSCDVSYELGLAQNKEITSSFWIGQGFRPGTSGSLHRSVPLPVLMLNSTTTFGYVPDRPAGGGFTLAKLGKQLCSQPGGYSPRLPRCNHALAALLAPGPYPLGHQLTLPSLQDAMHPQQAITGLAQQSHKVLKQTCQPTW